MYRMTSLLNVYAFRPWLRMLVVDDYLSIGTSRTCVCAPSASNVNLSIEEEACSFAMRARDDQKPA